jgi:hypothetical protein
MKTATNPETGEKVVLIGGEWKPYTSSATSKEGRKAFLVGGSWVTDDGVAPPAQETKTEQKKEPEASYADILTADPLIRAAKGVAAPLIGAVQGVLNADKPMIQNPLIAAAQMYGKAAGADKEINNLVKQNDEATKRGMKARGDGEFDLAGLFGNVVSPFMKVPVADKGAGLAAKTAVTTAGGAAAGASNVVTEDDYKGTKDKDVGIGSLFGVVTPSAEKLVKKVVAEGKNFAKPFTESGRSKLLYEYLDGLAGDAKSKVIKALNSVEEFVPGSKPTVGEALAETPEAAALAAYQKKLASTGEAKAGKQPVGVQFVTREAQNEAARKAAISNIAKTEDDLQAAIKDRAAVTGEMRKTAIGNANIAGKQVPELQAGIAEKEASKVSALQDAGRAESIAADQTTRSRNMFPVEPEKYPLMQRVLERKKQLGESTQVMDPSLDPRFAVPREKIVDPNKPNFMVPGYPKLSEKFTPQNARAGEWSEAAKDVLTVAEQRQMEKEFKMYQLESLEKHGLFPLMADPVVAKIDKLANSPGASTLTKQVFAEIKQKVADRMSGSGMIDANDLYTIRKEINNDILKFTKDQNWDKQVTSGLETNIKKAIDDAIEKAGGGGWKAYLNKFQEMSVPINQMQVGQELQKALTSSIGKERGAVFAKAVDDAPKTLKKANGDFRYNKLGAVLSPEQVAAVEGVQKDLVRLSGYDRLAGELSVPGAGNLAKDGIKAPQMLSRTATIANMALKLFRSGADDKIAEMATGLMLDPKKMAAFLTEIPAKQQQSYLMQMAKSLPPNVRAEFIRGAQAVRGATSTENLIKGAAIVGGRDE